MALPNLNVLTADNTVITIDNARYSADGGVFQPWIFDPSSLRNPNTAIYEVPVLNPPCSFTIEFPGGVYELRFTFCDINDTWILDISDSAEKRLVCGIPLVTGLDLLQPYVSLGVGARLFIIGATEPSEIPGYADLGTTARLYAEIPNVT